MAGREQNGDLLAEIKERIEDFFQGGQYSLSIRLLSVLLSDERYL